VAAGVGVDFADDFGDDFGEGAGAADAESSGVEDVDDCARAVERASNIRTESSNPFFMIGGSCVSEEMRRACEVKLY
jgi:hypothetical protein